jgi:hypothetical protein
MAAKVENPFDFRNSETLICRKNANKPQKIWKQLKKIFPL